MIATHYSPDAKAVVFTGDCLTFMREIPQESIQLVVSSPPYNIGKP